MCVEIREGGGGRGRGRDMDRGGCGKVALGKIDCHLLLKINRPNDLDS